MIILGFINWYFNLCLKKILFTMDDFEGMFCLLEKQDAEKFILYKN